MSPLGNAALAHVLLQDVDGCAVPADQGLEAAAGAHRAELAVIAHHHHLTERR